MQLGTKNGANFGFFGTICFRGHFAETRIAKVLLGIKPRRVGSFVDVSFPMFEKVW